jgi:CubicO group peptidase (beta-lactamase class C family)
MKKILTIITIILIIILFAFLLSPQYIRNALIYRYVGIDDEYIFYTREIQASKHPLNWKLSSSYNNKILPDSLLKKLEEYKTIAYLVAKNDSIIYESYWDKYSDSSLTNTFSATKSIVGLLIGCALDDGKIKSLNQRVINFIPEIKGKYAKEITIRSLLNMSSGSDWDENYAGLFSKTTQAYYGDDLYKIATEIRFDKKPDSIFQYQSGNTLLLGLILKKVTNKSISEYASEKLWQPIGAGHSAKWYLDKLNGTEKPYCCFCSNARDLAKIGKLISDSGRVNGRQVISENYIKSISQPDTTLINEKGLKNNFYGLHWWLLNYKGYNITYARGILGQYIFIIPELKVVIVRLGHERSQNYIGQHPSDVFQYLDIAFDILKP